MQWPDRIDEPVEDYLNRAGRVVRTFGVRTDSRARIVGAQVAGEHFVVKEASDPESVAWLESAVRFHSVVQHPVIAPVLASFRTPTGLALVEEWAPGQPLFDPFDATRLPLDHPDSVYQRFLRLPAEEIAQCVGLLIEAHVAVARASFVAVDLYEGCVMWDDATRSIRLIDLDHYQPGPYLLESERQIGSLSFMAPEELTRGAVVDERTMVYTVGRLALVLLGCPRRKTAERSLFRGTDNQFAIATRATQPNPNERFQTVSDLSARWSSR